MIFQTTPTHELNFFCKVLCGLDCVHMLTNLERGPKSELERHEEVMIFHQTESLSINLVLHKAVQVCLITKGSEEVSNILNSPRLQWCASRVGVRWVGGGREGGVTGGLHWVGEREKWRGVIRGGGGVIRGGERAGKGEGAVSEGGNE